MVPHYGDIKSNYRSIERLINSLFRVTMKKHQRSTLLSLCEGNPLVTGGFLTQRDSNTKNDSIWWQHNGPRKMTFCHSLNEVFNIFISWINSMYPWDDTCHHNWFTYTTLNHCQQAYITEHICNGIGNTIKILLGKQAHGLINSRKKPALAGKKS